MRILNIRIWAPFYIIGLMVILIIMWTVEAARPQGVALWIGTFLVLAVIFFNFMMMRNEIKAHEEKLEKYKELSGIEPTPKKKKRFPFGKKS